MNSPSISNWIGADAPQTHPDNDLYGYAPFSKRLADAACNTPSPEGLVIGINGGWGFGKTSVLNFIKFYLRQRKGNDQPIIVDFNPWWFSNRDDLAAQLLNQLRIKLPHESDALRQAGDALAKYSKAIGTAVATANGVPWLAGPISWGLSFFQRKPKDIPKLKQDIVAALKKSARRIIVTVDDVDRLTPTEISELLKALKALADFPNVVYLVAFDHSIVSHALGHALGVDGSAYLEKIVQAQFSLPHVDKGKLRSKLSSELDRVLEGNQPLRAFDQKRWLSIYADSLDAFIRSPRDIVRLSNALGVTYPAVAGEVNAVDFVAMEFLRVFAPTAYNTIRDNRASFNIRRSGDRGDDESLRKFHEGWISQLPEALRQQIRSLVGYLFPNLSGLWNRVTYGSDSLTEWRRNLRICSSEVWDVYFAFGVSPDAISRRELDEIVKSADPQSISDALMNAAKVRRPEGHSKARDILDRIRDLDDEIDAAAAKALTHAVFKVGDVVLTPDDERGGMFNSAPNSWRLRWLATFLLRQIPEAERLTLLGQLVRESEALGLSVDIVDALDAYLEKPEGNLPIGVNVDAEQVTALKQTVVTRLSANDPEVVLQNPHADMIFHRWMRWGVPGDVRGRLAPLFESQRTLRQLLVRFTQHSWRQAAGDRVVERVPYINPKMFAELTDLQALIPRVRELLGRNDLSDDERVAGEQFLKGMQRMERGKDTSGFFDDDDAIS